MEKVNNLMNYAYEHLSEENFPERKEEIFRMITHLLNIEKYHIINSMDIEVSQFDCDTFYQMIQQRKTGTPLAYILGYSYFYYDCFPVSEQTLIPRYDSEHLVEAAKKYFSCSGKNMILDVCTGTGVLALSLYRIFSNSIITGWDIVEDPFIRSCEKLNVDNQRVFFKKMDFLDSRNWYGMWDCIVSNPPYLNDEDMKNLTSSVSDFEPHTALYGGKDGMLFYRALREFSYSHLNTEGLLILEIDHKYQLVQELFPNHVFQFVELIYDYNNLPRVLVFKRR
ncbi:MAG: N5-glutamine methyltransferase family protein [Brevinemataceae bacterium]